MGLAGIVGDFALHHHILVMIALGLALALAVGHVSHRLLRGRALRRGDRDNPERRPE